MTLMVHIAMFGWPAVCLALFATLRPRTAVITGYLGGWMLLPIAAYDVPGLPDYTKAAAVSLSVFLGVVVFNPRALLALRPRLLDLPMLMWCISPLFSSMTNGLGVYDGLATSLGHVIEWGAPYAVGRAYFTSTQSIRTLAVGVFIAGLLYTPLCLWEIRMSPHLHQMVYGYAQTGFQQVMRFGGYRPMVFMQHGLAVGLFMTTASLIGVWLWMSGSLKHVYGAPMGLLVPILLATTLLGKSFGAIALLAMGLGTLFFTSRTRLRIAMVAVIAAGPVYMLARTAGGWSGAGVVSMASKISQDRARSLQFRLDNEDLLTAKALRKPTFGWGGWGRSRVYDDSGEDISTTDGMWVIALGVNGLFGLVSFWLALLTPVMFVVARLRARAWQSPAMAPVAAIAVSLTLFELDNLMNAMPNPMYMLMAGGLISLLTRKRQSRRASVLRRRRTTLHSAAPSAAHCAETA